MTDITITHWQGLRVAHGGRREVLSWADLIRFLSPTPPPPFAGEGSSRDDPNFEPGHPGWSPAVFRGDHRAKDSILEVSALAAEHDAGTVPVELAAAILRARGVSAIVVTTKSHVPSAPRWRVVIQLAAGATIPQRDALIAQVSTWGLDLAPAESKDPARFWFTTCRGAHEESGRAIVIEGRSLELPEVGASEREEADDQPSVGGGTGLPSNAAAFAQKALASAVRNIEQAGKGSRHEIAAKEAYAIGGFVGAGALSQSEALTALKQACRVAWADNPHDAKSDGERTVRTQLLEGAKKPRIIQDRPRPQPASNAMPKPQVEPFSPTNEPPPRPALRLVGPDEQANPARFKRGDHLELAQGLIQEVSGDLAYDEGALYQYQPDNGLWTELDKSALARVVHTFAGATVEGDKKPLRINTPTVEGAIDQAQHITRKVDFFANAPVGLGFKDGFVHALSTGLKWSEHSPDHRARVGYSFDCRQCSGVPCPQWLSFLQSVWPVVEKDEEGRELSEAMIQANREDQEAKIRLLQQFLGACLVGVATKYQIALVLVGEGSNGKSTLIKTIEALFPARSVAHVAPQDLGDEYRLALLAGKRFNTVAELPTSEIMASERFKAVVDGSEVTARQIRQEPITFQPRAGHLYATNALPPVTDMSHGFWSRFIVLRFSQVFPRGTQARELWRELVDAEGPAIIGWMLDGAADLLAAAGYQTPPSSRAEVEAWRKKADSVAAFLEECCDIPGPGDDRAHFWTQAGPLFETYSKWTEECRLRGVSKQRFAERMHLLGHPFKRTATARTYPVTVRRVLG